MIQFINGKWHGKEAFDAGPSAWSCGSSAAWGEPEHRSRE